MHNINIMNSGTKNKLIITFFVLSILVLAYLWYDFIINFDNASGRLDLQNIGIWTIVFMQWFYLWKKQAYNEKHK